MISTTVFNSNRVSAACALITLILGLPAAMFSAWNAISASQKASEAQQALKQMEMLASATQALARSADQNVAVSRARLDAAYQAVDAAQESARASRDQAGAAMRAAASTEGLTNETRRMAELAARSSAEAPALYEQANRAKVVFRSVDLQAFGIGKKTRVLLHFENIGKDVPSQIKMWSLFQVLDGKTTPSAPPCGQGRWEDVGTWSLGRFRSEFGIPLNQAMLSEIQRRNGFYAYGALCYMDSFGKQRRTDFCSFVKPDGDADQCPTTRPPS